MEGLDRLHQEGIIRVDFCFESHASVIWRLMKKYRDLPMDFADACLVRMSELNDHCRVWTVDSDFRVYRRHGRQVIPLIFPDSRPTG